MISQIILRQVGVFMTWVLVVGFQETVRIPNDASGVGAAGTIGRGTSEGEHFVSVTRTAPATMVPSTFVPAVAAEPTLAPTEVAPPAIVNREMTPADVLTVSLPALVRRNPYLGYHRGWVHGYWNARITGSPLRLIAGPGGSDLASWKGPVPGPGRGLGWGLPGWSIGPMVYEWGYLPYENPFVRGSLPTGAVRVRFDDYSLPLDVQNPPPTLSLLNDALTSFRSARQAFLRADYGKALEQTDAALQLMPDDPIIQQFRALDLFASKRYDEAAAVLHAVLPVVPGWDWRTMVSLYKDPENYTRQLRLLEEYTAANPGSAAAHFLLAYHYLVLGYTDEAVGQWERVVTLRPNDRLSAGLIRELQPSRPADPRMLAATSTESAAGESAVSPPPAGPAGELVGTWVARRKPDTTITLEFQPKGLMVWKVSRAGREEEFAGFTINEKKVLTFYQDQDNGLVGTLTWQDEDHFRFRVLTSPPEDPGLAFARRR